MLTLTNTPSPVFVGDKMNYRLSVSNATGFNLNPGVITSQYGTNAEFVLATNSFGFTNTPGLVIFDIPANSFPANGVIQVFLQLRGTNAGQFTNTFTVAIDDQGRTTNAVTNVVSTIALTEADLGVSIVGPPNAVFLDDSFSYQLLATNVGPDVVPGVVVSNSFPSDLVLIDFSPSASIELGDGFVLFSVASLTNLASATATLSVLATNAAASNIISATIRAPHVADTNQANNSFSTNVPVLTPVLDQIIVTNVFPQDLNPQTGWMEQHLVLQNVSITNVASVRLLVDGLTNRLVNATGTNGNTPYVAHGAVLAAGEQLDLILEYFNPTRTAGADPLFTAYGTPPLDLTPQAGSQVTVDRVLQLNATNLNNGRILLEWPATNHASYQVIYSDQVNFSNAYRSLPLVTTPAGANRVQWLDYGPPRTLSAPGHTGSRFYKVIELP